MKTLYLGVYVAHSNTSSDVYLYNIYVQIINYM